MKVFTRKRSLGVCLFSFVVFITGVVALPSASATTTYPSSVNFYNGHYGFMGAGSEIVSTDGNQRMFLNGSCQMEVDAKSAGKWKEAWHSSGTSSDPDCYLLFQVGRRGDGSYYALVQLIADARVFKSWQWTDTTADSQYYRVYMLTNGDVALYAMDGKGHRLGVDHNLREHHCWDAARAGLCLYLG